MPTVASSSWYVVAAAPAASRASAARSLASSSNWRLSASSALRVGRGADRDVRCLGGRPESGERYPVSTQPVPYRTKLLGIRRQADIGREFRRPRLRGRQFPLPLLELRDGLRMVCARQGELSAPLGGLGVRLAHPVIRWHAAVLVREAVLPRRYLRQVRVEPLDRGTLSLELPLELLDPRRRAASRAPSPM